MPSEITSTPRARASATVRMSRVERYSGTPSRRREPRISRRARAAASSAGVELGDVDALGGPGQRERERVVHAHLDTAAGHLDRDRRRAGAVDDRRDRGGAGARSAGLRLADAALPDAHAHPVAVERRRRPRRSCARESAGARSSRGPSSASANDVGVVDRQHAVRVADRDEAVGDARDRARRDPPAGPRARPARGAPRCGRRRGRGASPVPAPVRTRSSLQPEALGRVGGGDAGAVAGDLGDRAVAVVHDDGDLVVAQRELEHAVGAEPERDVAEQARARRRDRPGRPLDDQEVVPERLPLRDAHGRNGSDQRGCRKRASVEATRAIASPSTHSPGWCA